MDIRKFRRGDIFFIRGANGAVGSEVWSNRPAVVISNQKLLDSNTHTVTVVYLTTSDKIPLRTHVSVISGTKRAIALCEQLFSVDESRVGDYIGHLTDSEIDAIDSAIAFSIGIRTDTAIMNEKTEAVEKMKLLKKENKTLKHQLEGNVVGV